MFMMSYLGKGEEKKAKGVRIDEEKHVKYRKYKLSAGDVAEWYNTYLVPTKPCVLFLPKKKKGGEKYYVEGFKT